MQAVRQNSPAQVKTNSRPAGVAVKLAGGVWGALTQWKNVTELAGRTTGKERTVHAGRTDGRLKDARLSGQVCVTHTRPVFLSASTW